MGRTQSFDLSVRRSNGGGVVPGATEWSFGAVDEKFAAATHNGWRAILGDGLKRHVERG